MTVPTPSPVTTPVVVDPGAGPGPSLVLVHGVGLDHTMWDLIVPTLTARPAGPGRVVRYDLIGHGRTPTADGAVTIETFVDQLIAVCNGPDVPDQPDLVGLSLGGAIVRGAAARHPGRFNSVVIANAVFQRTEAQRRGNLDRLRLAADQGMGPVADLAVDRWFTPQWSRANPERSAAVQRTLATADLDGYLAAYRVFVDGDPAMPALLPSLTNRTLVVTGDRDTGSTPAMTEAMAALLPDGTARILADTGHLPPVEHPALFADLLIEFLEATS